MQCQAKKALIPIPKKSLHHDHKARWWLVFVGAKGPTLRSNFVHRPYREP
jgi:hypothetical protein